jgi:PAS domain S-box-containing protein
VNKPAIPSLKDLRSSTSKAWLWDIERVRIVWANGPGIAFFEGQSLFDLIDRPFDPQEPGVEGIKSASALFGTAESTPVDLVFPSAGQTSAVACVCTPYKLSDGRTGVLVVEVLPVETLPQALSEPPSALQQAFKLLPTAMAFVSKDGDVTYCNDAAEALLPVGAGGNIQDLLPGRKLATALKRLTATSVVSATGRLKGRFGERDVKIAMRKLPEGGSEFAFAIFEDITERRMLEAQIPDDRKDWADALPAQQEPGKALEQLAQSIKQEMAAKPGNGKLAVQAKVKFPDSDEIRDGGRQQTIPDTIKQAMERSGEAVVIAQKGRAVFATEKAADLFGFENSDSLIGSSDIPSQLNGLAESKVELRLPKRDGVLVDVTVISTHIPWLHGAARQFRIRPANGNAVRNGKADVTTAVKQPLQTATEQTAPAAGLSVAAAPELVMKPTSRGNGKRKSAEFVQDELRAILDVVSDGIVTLDSDGRILSFSAGAESIFGTSIGDVIGVPFASLLHDDSRQVLRDYLASLTGPGLASVFNDGREIVALVKPQGTVPLFLTLGKLQSTSTDAAYCAVVRDITQWKRTERDLREAKHEADASVRQKSEFLARMGHELRTPITAILGFADMMRQENTKDWRRDKFAGYANDIHSSGTHLLSLINDLLDLSKVEAGKMELDFTEVRLKDPVGDAVRMVGEQAAQAGVVVRTAIPDRLPKVVGDLRALRQILLNLLSNAVKFTDQGGEVIVSAALDDGGNMHLKVKDTGIGMTVTQIEDALEPFKRIRTEGRETTGTGLGLPLTRALVEANRARFDISSEKGKGTTVDIVFPTNRVLSE